MISSFSLLIESKHSKEKERDKSLAKELKLLKSKMITSNIELAKTKD